jgi:hypothetical protein
MSNRKPSTASKRARRPKIITRAQRTKQSLVRSPKENPSSIIRGGSAESPPTLDTASKQEGPIVENRAAALQDLKETMRRDGDSKRALSFSLATANVQAYQAKLLEMAQANVQFAFEFARRFAAIRSPFELPSVIAEITSKRIGMFQKFSQEMAELISGEKTISE